MANLTPSLVRQIRMDHFLDQKTVCDIARDYLLSNSCVSRILTWGSWANQDLDLKGLPRPPHSASNHRLTPEQKLQNLRQGITCTSCQFFDQKTRDCDLGFPECIASQYREAKHCAAYLAGKPVAA